MKLIQIFCWKFSLLFAVLVLNNSANAQSNLVPDNVELEVLRNIYDSLGGDSWTNRTNWPTLSSWPATATSSQFDTWQGVVVTNGDITGILLSGNNLQGLLPKSVAQLTRLTSLNLRNNHIVGEIPASYTTLTSLTSLILDTNDLTGSIPTTIGDLQNLTKLNIGSNEMTGSIPSSLWTLTALTELYINTNSFTGSIPTSIGNLTGLQYLSLRNNQFSGALPSTIVNLQSLKNLYVANNSFSGDLPAGMENLSQLVVLELTNNSLTGVLPSVENWVNLREFRVGGNEFSGSLPSHLGLCQSLTMITAEFNALTGIPDGLLNLPVLVTLNIAQNNLETIPDFSAQINKANLTLNISMNKLSFADLEKVYNKGIKTLTYSSQKAYDNLRWVHIKTGETLILTAKDPGVNGTVVWEIRPDGAGGWSPANSLNEDQTQRTFKLSNFSGSEDGRFRYRVTNTIFPGLTLSSVDILVRAGQPTVWNSQVGIIEDNDALQKTAADGWGNAGALSENLLAGNTDGSVDFGPDDASLSSKYIIGFSSTGASYSASDIAYGIELVNNAGVKRVIIHESDSNGIDVTNWVVGDIFQIAREGNSVKYYRNGGVIRTVTVDPTIQLNAKIALHSGSAPPSSCSFWIPSSRGIVPDAWEYRALRELYDSLGGTQWTRSNNWSSVTSKTINITAAQMDPWFGIVVGGGDITRVELPSNNLVGKVPASIGVLKRLNRLRIQDNKLVGQIPDEIGNLTSLTFLNLAMNNFTGEIPASLGNLTNLTWLGLYTIPLEGELPVSLFNLVNLENLYIFYTNISGEIPEQIGSLTKIKVLHLYQNKLTGPLPQALFSLTSLTNFAVSNNHTLNGIIPPDIGNLVNLTELWLNGNDFSGPLPSSLGNLTKMKYLQLSGNRFTEQIPPSMASMTGLEWAALAINDFSGPIPRWFGDMPLLDSLWLYSNKFSGEIPENLKNATSLALLMIQDNQLEGELPSWLGNLTKLKTLYVGKNNLTGALPATIQNLNVLKNFDVSFTNMSGEIPDFLVGKASLRWLGVNDARFTSLPDFSVRSDKHLLSISAHNNQIQLDDIEANFEGPESHAFASFTYSPQNNPFDKDSFSFPIGSQLIVEAPDGGINGVYLWEKLVGGVWTNINSLNEGTEPNVFVVQSVDETWAGTYRYTVSNSWVPDVIFESGPFEIQVTDVVVANPIKPLYNGLITAVRWRTSKPHSVDGDEFRGMYVYDYDAKYQIKDASWATYNATTYSYSGNTFRLTGMAYDPNGNILQLKRYDANARRIHDFTYLIEANKNRLLSVGGYVHQYQYNAIGQMTHEDREDGDDDDKYIIYDVSGKVVKVYTGKQPEQCSGCPPTPPVPDPDIEDAPEGLTLTIENLYDDRGFRLAKINHLTKKTTWYIRDASGNVLSIYEEDNNSHELAEKEIPIYGSGKIGTYYPEEDGSSVYEITDHLGNVRALLRENINTYVATMEDNGLEDITNPRVEEMAYFENLFETEKDNERFMNVTVASTDEPDPRKVSYLFWNDTPGTLAEEKAIGPSWAKRVSAGDKIDAKVWTRYEEKVSYAKDFDLMMFASLLGNTFSTMAGFEGYSLSQTTSSLHSGLLAPTFQDNDADDTRPYAYLNYIVYDEDMNMVASRRFRVPDTAGSDQASLYLPGNEPVEMGFDNTLEIAQNGYLYIWLSNESKEARVWFDDLTITHEEHFVVQATDYGVWGDIIREQKSDVASYRYGYQGQFAEKDEETGWNHFELREFEPAIGRWTSTDAARQLWSPYIGVGNNPVSQVDPDGAFSRFGAWWRNGFSMDGVYAVEGDWGYSRNSVIRFVDPDFGKVEAFRHQFIYEDFLSQHGNVFSHLSDAVSRIWNSPFMRVIIPDYYVYGKSVNIGFGGYGGTEVNVYLMLRGQDPGIYMNSVTVFGVQTSAGVDVGAHLGYGYFATLSPENITSDVFGGTQISAALGVESKIVEGGGLGMSIDIGLDENGRATTFERKIYGTLGYGFAFPVHGGAGGGSASPVRPIIKF